MRRVARTRRGFSLIEAAVATGIVGVGFVALMQFYLAVTMHNRAANELTTGTMLAEHIAQAMSMMPLTEPGYDTGNFGPEAFETLATYDDVDDFNNQSFQPPIDAAKQPIPELPDWRQSVVVERLGPNAINANADGAVTALSTNTGVVRVTVRVSREQFDGSFREVANMSWLQVEK